MLFLFCPAGRNAPNDVGNTRRPARRPVKTEFVAGWEGHDPERSVLLLRFLRPARVTALADGRAVVEGRVVAPHTLSIAGSQSRPVWFDMTIESYRTGDRGRGRPMWIPSSADDQVVPFALDDGTGTVWVAAAKGSYVVGGSVRREVGLVGKRGTSRFVANLILPGDVVRVRGDVGDATEGEPPGKVLRGSAKRPLQILFRKAAR